MSDLCFIVWLIFYLIAKKDIIIELPTVHTGMKDMCIVGHRQWQTSVGSGERKRI
jgi:hypothetical protein